MMRHTPSMASGDKKPARSRVVLTDISSRAWEHPADKGALVALRKLGFNSRTQVATWVVSRNTDNGNSP